MSDMDRIRGILDQLAVDTMPGETDRADTFDAYESAIDQISRVAYPKEW